MAERPAQEAAAGIAGDLISEVAQEGFLEDDEAPEGEPTGEQQQDDDGIEVPEITWETPEELRDVLETPDFDEDEEIEEFEGEGNVAPTFDDDEFEDPEKARMAKQIKKMQKQLAWSEEQKVKASKKAWSDEARKYFQFSNPEVIQAKSRRAFLKEAQRQHQAVTKIAKPIFDAMAEERAKIKEQALAEAKAEAEQRWGRPTTGPTATTNIEDTQRMSRQRLEAGRTLTDVLKAKIRSGEVNV